ncbi:polyprenyl synthetase family protein [Kiritimatiellaeota bacterium B1221]|nr:polyprenyl synthetase family protein [Kiritimatiellaeota bacterium B1221]
MSTPISIDKSTDLDSHLESVTALIIHTLKETSLSGLVKESASLVGLGGKMLRSRLVYRLGTALGNDPQLMVYGSAAVEMIHTASLLHDDVIDGGVLRRGMPTFWVEKGPAGAILLGDLLLFKAIDLICRVADGRYTHDLVKLTGEVCEAESEQELILTGEDSKLEVCQSIARRKTGALFAFAALINGKGEQQRTASLKESGYLLGTVYQLADDILDTREDPHCGKTLGTDAARGIVSAANLDEDKLRAHLETLKSEACQMLDGDDDALEGIQTYIEKDLQPAIDNLLA